MKLVEKTARKDAVKNAFEHKGKADVNAVVGKIMALHKGIKLVHEMPTIKVIVEEVNQLSRQALEEEYQKLKGEFELKPTQKEEGLPELDFASKEKIVTRFAPNPNARMHIGHARQALLSYWYAEKYKGTFLLRFDDTDPKVKKPMERAEEIFKEELEWLGVHRIDATVFASDRLELYYQRIEELLRKGKAYICKCEPEKWRALIQKGKECKCRNLKPSEHLEDWKQMLNNEVLEGKAVVRLKTDVKHPDPSVRDWWMAKVVNNVNHPNPSAVHKHVWPSYNLASAIDDHELGVTLIIRGQEHSQNATKQAFLYEYFHWTYPHCLHTGRLSLDQSMLSSSKIQEGITEGKYVGWDDPRVGSILSLKERGIESKAIQKAIMQVGVKTSDANISLESLHDYNRKLIDEESERITFMQKPVELEVRYSKACTARIPLHPDYPEQGDKEYSLKEGVEKFYVEEKSLKALKEETMFRLRNAYNARLSEKEGDHASAEFNGFTKGSMPILHWLQPENTVQVQVRMSDASMILGIAESKLKELKEGSHAYFEKFGYVKVASTGSQVVYCNYTHK